MYKEPISRRGWEEQPTFWAHSIEPYRGECLCFCKGPKELTQVCISSGASWFLERVVKSSPRTLRSRNRGQRSTAMRANVWIRCYGSPQSSPSGLGRCVNSGAFASVVFFSTKGGGELDLFQTLRPQSTPRAASRRWNMTSVLVLQYLYRSAMSR